MSKILKKMLLIMFFSFLLSFVCVHSVSAISPPKINSVERSINNPTDTDDVKVTANVSDVSLSGKVELYYNTTYTSGHVVLMVLTQGDEHEGIYEGSISKQEKDIIVNYYVNASNPAGSVFSITYTYTVNESPSDDDDDTKDEKETQPVNYELLTISIVSFSIVAGVVIGVGIYFQKNPEKAKTISNKLRGKPNR